MSERKRAICPVGAGSMSIAHLGFFKYLKEHEIEWHAGFGASGAALTLAAYGVGGYQYAYDLWMNITDAHVRKNHLIPFHDGSLYDSSPLLETIQQYIDVDKLKAFPKPLIITVSDVKNVCAMRLDITKPGDFDVHKMLLASASIPLAFPAVNHMYYDGGIYDDYSVLHAANDWYQDIVVFHPSMPAPIIPEGIHDGIDVYMTNMLWANYMVQRDRMKCSPQFNLIEVLPPKTQMKRPSVLDFSSSKEERLALIQYGYEMTKEAFEAAKQNDTLRSMLNDQAQ